MSDLVNKAIKDLEHCRTFKKVGDNTPSCIEEKKALEKARQRLSISEGPHRPDDPPPILTAHAREDLSGGGVDDVADGVDGDTARRNDDRDRPRLDR